MKDLFNVDEMAELLKVLEEKNQGVDAVLDANLSEEMQASERRVQEILEKHTTE